MLMTNLLAVDHSDAVRLQQRKRMNEQNQSYLRIQMKQKLDDARLSKSVHKEHVDRYDYSAPEENYNYVNKASSMVRSQAKEAQKEQLFQ